MWEYFLVGIVTFLSRAIPRLIKRHAVNTDTYYHFLRAEKIRQSKFKYPVDDEQMQQFGGLYYPSLYHYMLATLPRIWREHCEPWIGGILDTIYVIMFMVFAQTYMGNCMNGNMLVLFGMAFAFNPLLTYVSPGLRAYQGTPRILGQVLVAASLLSLYQYVQEGQNIWLMLFAVSGCGVVISSRFALQAWLMTLLVLSVAMANITIALGTIIALGIAVVVSKGGCIKGCLEHLDNIKNYFTFREQYDNSFIKRTGKYRPATLLERIKWLFSHYEISIYFIRNFSALILIVLMVVAYAKGLTVDDNIFLLVWFVSLQCVFLLTSRYALSFLGEAERYLEYAVVPLMILIGSNIMLLGGDSAPLIQLGLLVLYYIPFYVLQVVFFVVRAKMSYDDIEYDELIEQLRQIKRSRVLSILKDGPWKLVYLTNHYVVYRPVLGSVRSAAQEIKKFFSFVPYPQADIDRYVREDGVSLVAVEKRVIELQATQAIRYDFSRLVKIFENSKYILYESG